MAQLDDLTRAIPTPRELTAAEIAAAATELTDPQISDESKGNFLRALAVRGETANEVAAFAREFRARAINPGVEKWTAQAIDVVGTGGDHAGGFNISTLVVFTLAAAGVTVMKHGNRGITSKTGSADLFAGLGVNLEAPPEKLRQALSELGFVFFFAPAYHPSFKHVAAVRRQLAAQGQRTIFNILGPLVNPGQPAHTLLGVFSRRWVSLLADAVHQLGMEAGLAVHGSLSDERGIDEMTTATPNTVRGIGRLRNVDTVWLPDAHGFVRSPFDDLKGGELATNLAIVDAVLEGRGPKGLVDTIVLNAATALWIMGRVRTIPEGAGLARDQLLGGGVKAKIAATREFYAS